MDGHQRRRRLRTEAAPKCMHHCVLMRVTTVLPSVRYFRCPVDGCGHTSKQARRDIDHDKLSPPEPS